MASSFSLFHVQGKRNKYQKTKDQFPAGSSAPLRVEGEAGIIGKKKSVQLTDKLTRLLSHGTLTLEFLHAYLIFTITTTFK